jgi:hypothetical protein
MGEVRLGSKQIDEFRRREARLLVIVAAKGSAAIEFRCGENR